MSDLTHFDHRRRGYSGGGIYNAGTMTVTNSIIEGNSAIAHGGGIYNAGTMTVTNSIIDHNNSAWNGGGIFNGVTMTVTNSTIDKGATRLTHSTRWRHPELRHDDGHQLHHRPQFGGVRVRRWWHRQRDGHVDRRQLHHRSQLRGAVGGGICSEFATLTVTITNSTIANNTAEDGGGGICLISGMLTAVNSTIAYNNVAREGTGGGLDAFDGTAVLYNTIVAQNNITAGSTPLTTSPSSTRGATPSEAHCPCRAPTT